MLAVVLSIMPLWQALRVNKPSTNILSSSEALKISHVCSPRLPQKIGLPERHYCPGEHSWIGWLMLEIAQVDNFPITQAAQELMALQQPLLSTRQQEIAQASKPLDFALSR